MRRAEPQRAPEPVIEEGLLPHIVGLQASTPLDGSLPGVSLKAAGLLAWHPTRQRLLVASPVAAVEYDAVSGARRNLVEVAGTPLHVTYTPSGSAIILLTKERGIFCWSTSTWKRRVLLPPDSKYAGKQLAAGLLAVSSGQHPVVYWTPLGKNTVRMVNTAPVEVPKGGKLERDMVPGVKLKTENKKPIVGLAVHPTERGTLFVLLADASLHVCSVSGAAIATLSTFPIPGINPAAERVAVHAWPHPILPGAAMLAVEAAVGGISILEHAPRQEPRLLGTLAFGAGSTMCGVGLLSSGLLCAAGRHASGNVQVQAWELAGDSRELQVLPTTLVPGLVWDAMQGLAGKAALADVSGDSLITRLHFQQASGAVAVATARRGGGGEPAHQRVPLLHLINGPEGAGAPQRLPLHTGLGFWTARDSGDSTVSKLRFPRYVHVISGGRVCNYDLTHGMLSDCLVLPPTNSAGQERLLVRAVRSTRQPAWLAFARVLSRRPEEAVLGPGQCEFALVSDSDAALTSGQWMLPGADGVFVGAADDTVAVLANSGRCLMVYETARLGSAGAAAKPLFSAELREGLIAAVHAGPPAHIPSPPLPSPVPPPADGDQADSDDSDAGEDDASRALRQEWEEGERARLQPPRLVLLQTQSNLLVLAEVSSGAASYAGKARQLPTSASLALRRSEVLLQVAWQSLVPPDGSFHSGSEGAGSAAAAVAAVLTSQRVLLLTERLVLVASAAIPPDLGLPVSCLWVGPALLVSTSTGQVLQVCWDGKLVHVCSLLQGTAPALLGALADRLLVATKPSPAGRVEVGGRGVNILQPLLLGWVSLVQRHLLPGGAARARRELRTLVASYDASHLGVTALERLAAAGFADVAAAVAASSDSAAITPAHKAVFQAAAGDWQPLLLLVMQEWESSSWHPGPPPRSSQLYARMVALARTCQQYGRFSDARQLLEGAGAHGELMALCVFQGDFSGLQAHARKGGRDAERLADQLMAVNENAFVHGSNDGSLFGGRANTDDWTVTVAAVGEAEGSASRRHAPAAGSGGVGGAGEAAESVPGSGAGSGPMEVEVAPAGRLPFQEASLQVLSAADPAAPAPGGDLEGQPIEGLDLATLSAYVGLSGAHVIKPAVSTPTASSAAAAAPALGGGVSLSRMETGLSELSNPLEPELAAAIGASRAAPRGGWESGSEGRPAVGRDETTAQAAARAAFRRDTADDEDDFFSSDEESAPTEADSRSVASMTTNSAAPGGSQRFRISIKPADEAAAAGAPAARPDTGMLRTAALSLRLGGMSLSGSADSTPFSTSRSAASLGSAARPGTLPPPPASSATSGAAPPLAVKASTSTGGGPDGQAPSSSVSGDDPFAGLFGLQAPQAQQPGTKAAPPPPPPAAAAASGPMRPPAAPAAQQSNLLSGWDDFESLFAAAPATGQQQQQQQQQQQPGIDLFGPVSFPPLPPPASTPLQPPAGSPAKPSAGAPAPAAAPAVEGPTMRRSGSVAELAPAAAKKAVEGGLAAFQAGQWQAAASSFGTAMDKAGSTDPAFAQQALLLYVAARLLDAAAAAAKKAQAATAARLARFALALPLEDAQRLAAVAYAVDANMSARNYGFAADQLTWLIIQSTSGAGGLDAMALQDKLNACDRAGGGNGALPRDEDRESFAAIVSSCSQRGEAEELVGNIISAG